MPYAFEELRSLLSRLTRPIRDDDHVLRYVSSLVAELAYYNVPAAEIGSQKRALLVPCDAFRAIMARGIPTNVLAYLRSQDFGDTFAIVTRGVVVVGLPVSDILFVGFRGTAFLHEWFINGSVLLVPSKPFLSARSIPGSADRFHRGFIKEAARVFPLLYAELKSRRYTELHFAGHSLGGAVAALCSMGGGPVSCCVFGTPRYCSKSVYSSMSRLPVHVQRPGDIVPYVPSRSLGYADPPYSRYDTMGAPVSWTSMDTSLLSLLRGAATFGKQRAKPHFIELYRKDLGRTAGALQSEEELAPFDKLR